MLVKCIKDIRIGGNLGVWCREGELYLCIKRTAGCAWVKWEMTSIGMERKYYGDYKIMVAGGLIITGTTFSKHFEIFNRRNNVVF